MTNGSAVTRAGNTRDNENVVTRAANTRNNDNATSGAGSTRNNENAVPGGGDTRNNGSAVTRAANTRNNDNAVSGAGDTRNNGSAVSGGEGARSNSAVSGAGITRSNDSATSRAEGTRNNDNAVSGGGDTRDNENVVTRAANTRNNDNAVSGAGDTRNNQNTTSTAHIEKYYNKFNEDHRLTTRHGIVEFTVTMQAIEDCAEELRLARGDTRHNDNATSLAEGALTRHNQNVVTSDEITRNNDSTTSDAGVTLHNNNPPSLAEGALTRHSNNVVSTPGVTLHSNNVVSSAEGALHNDNASSPAEGALTRHNQNVVSAPGVALHNQNVVSAPGVALHNQNPSPLPLKIADIGAGTGRYSIALAQKGYDVTAVELVKRNLEVLRSKHQNVKTWQGDARNLHFLPDNTFDITLLFGPLYHLHGTEEKLKAIKEAMRITKKGGKILIAYVMNEYSVISYCFKTHHWQEVAQKNGITADFHTISAPDELYDYVRLSDINELNQLAGLKRQKIIAPDGPADYMRRELNEMSDSEFQAFIDFQKANCARPELLGASSHIVDICTF